MKYRVLVIIVLLTSLVNAQITDTGNRIGIGTTTPSKKLDVKGTILVEGNDGFIANFLAPTNTWAEISLQNFSGPDDTAVRAQFKVEGGRVEIGSRTVNPVHFGAGDNRSHLIILPNGNVGVNTQNPDGKFAVKGKVHAQEVKVDLSLPAPDYVFENSYELKSLIEIENYINDNKQEYTFWEYMGGAWQKNHGMRIDHFLISNSLINNIKDIKINKYPRGKIKPSDHTPIELEIN